MPDDLKPYPAYQSSDLPWPGDVPAHWKIERAKRLFQRMERPVLPEHGVVTCFRDGIVTLRKNRRTTGFTESLKEIGYQGVERGDLVIHVMDAAAGAVGVSDSDGKCTPVYLVCQPKPDVDAHYYAHLIREMARSQWIVALARGIRERSTDFRYDIFGNQPVVWPPLEEQRAIARYLAHHDALIRRYIRAKQKMIALFNEQKQAIIHRAVTRGLDPNVKLKPSGVEWLGEVPEHWELRRLRYLAHIKTGERNTEDNIEDGLYPFFVRSQTAERINSYSFDGEAVLTAGDGAGVAKVFHYVNGKFDYHQRVYKFSGFKDVLGKFFFYYIRANLKDEVLKLSAKSTVDSLRLPMLQNFPVVLPSLQEQAEIIESIELQATDLDRTIAHAQHQIALIREYRMRLIADVVTGKVDVRGAAANLPEVEEPLVDENEAVETEIEEDEPQELNDADE